MTEPRRNVRDLATVALAVAAPAALFSGIGIGVTLIGGPPIFLILVFVAAVATITVSLLALAADTTRTNRD